MSDDESAVDLFIAAYQDADGAGEDWAGLKQLADDKTVSLEALVLINRDDDGKIHIKDTSHVVGAGTAIGAVGGALLGLIFPPSLLATAVVGAGIGAGAGAGVRALEKRQVKADVERTLPPGSSGILVLVEERWVGDVEKALPRASKVEYHHAHDVDQRGRAGDIANVLLGSDIVGRVDDSWVDLFNLIRVDGVWKITNMTAAHASRAGGA